MKKVMLSFSLALIGILSSCMKMPRYRKPTLETFSHNPNDARKINNVIVKVSTLDIQACQKIFGPRGKRISQNRPLTRFVPCHIFIKNNSSRSYIIKPKNISPSLIPAERIIKRISVHTPRRIGPFIGGATVLALAKEAFIPTAAFFCGFSFINMMRWSCYNEDLANSIYDLCLSSAITINPQQQVDKIVFFKEHEFKNNLLYITLYDADDYRHVLHFELDARK